MARFVTYASGASALSLAIYTNCIINSSENLHQAGQVKLPCSPRDSDDRDARSLNELWGRVPSWKRGFPKHFAL